MRPGGGRQSDQWTALAFRAVLVDTLSSSRSCRGWCHASVTAASRAWGGPRLAMCHGEGRLWRGGRATSGAAVRVLSRVACGVAFPLLDWCPSLHVEEDGERFVLFGARCDGACECPPALVGARRLAQVTHGLPVVWCGSTVILVAWGEYGLAVSRESEDGWLYPFSCQPAHPGWALLVSSAVVARVGLRLRCGAPPCGSISLVHPAVCHRYAR